jgi:hypothetical protein
MTNSAIYTGPFVLSGEWKQGDYDGLDNKCLINFGEKKILLWNVHLEDREFR